MKLYDYMKLVADGEEISVWDKEYDMETYFYGGKPKDRWDNAVSDLSKLKKSKKMVWLWICWKNRIVKTLNKQVG